MSDDSQQSTAPEQKPKVLINPPVFFTSVAIIAAMVLFSVIVPETAETVFDNVKARVISDAGWFYVLTVAIIITLVTFLAVSRFGDIKLGKDHSEPDYSYGSWFAMLFSAGMGIGLMFFGVLEPAYYFGTPWGDAPLGTVRPFGEDGALIQENVAEARRMALAATSFHWALHPWAIYAVVALALALFSYNKGLPLSIRSAFYPIFGERVWGWTGHIIDTLAVFATLFGLATSLGIGAQQANAGINYVYGVPNTMTVQVLLICGITAIALVSVLRGLDGGVKVLSEINMVVAMVLLLFVLFTAGAVGIFTDFISTLGAYVQEVIPLSNPHGREDTGYMQGWTAFYWAWWISWSPFVGMFIARVSKGRTVREFVTAVLIIPTVITTVWMSGFGGTALEQIQQGVGVLAENGLTEVSLATFQMFEGLPLTGIISFVGIILVLVFFVTSSDSGSLVIDSITAGGKTDAPTAQRVFWVVMEGAIAAALIFGGGDDALGAIQAVAISAGLPFTVILLIMTWGLLKGLTHERKLLLQRGELL